MTALPEVLTRLRGIWCLSQFTPWEPVQVLAGGAKIGPLL